jgi:hypothetical protein
VFSGLRKRIVLRSYRGRLGRQLVRMYGRHRMFSVPELRAAVTRGGLSTEYFSYAVALYCTHEAFDAYHASLGQRQDYDALRREIFPPVRHTIDGGDGGGGGGDGWSFDFGGDGCGSGDGGGGD